MVQARLAISPLDETIFGEPSIRQNVHQENLPLEEPTLVKTSVSQKFVTESTRHQKTL